MLADNVVQRLEDADKAARLRLVILDACRNNPKGWRVRADRGLAPIQTGNQFTLVGFSTNERAPALDAVGAAPYSPYAEALSRWLLRSSELPVRSIFDRTATEVRRVTGDKQMPRVSGDLPGDVLLSGQAQSDDFLAWEVARVAGSVAATEEFLKSFPSSRWVPQARIQLAALRGKVQPLEPRVGKILKDCDVCPELVVLPQGSFVIGSPLSELKRAEDEGPQKTVRINYNLAVGRFEVTQGQWKALMGFNPSSFKLCGDNCPVEMVSWLDSQEYIKKLNTKTGKKYRLLSESEWEYAARATTNTPFYTGVAINSSQANFDGRYSYGGSELGNYVGGTVAVGKYPPNNFGLYDMIGNVSEWVQDVYHADYDGLPSDGSPWESGGASSNRVFRGGAWSNFPWFVRVSFREWDPLDNKLMVRGFRVARVY